MNDPVFEGVAAAIHETLECEPEAIVPGARFFEDLGGESIDVLDVTFRCERRFGITLRLNDLVSPANVETDASGHLTPESLAALKSDFPFLDFTPIGERPLENRLRELLTVQAIADFVRRALDEKQAQTTGRSAG